MTTPLAANSPECLAFLEGCRLRTGLILQCVDLGAHHLKVITADSARIFCLVQRATGNLFRPGPWKTMTREPLGNLFAPDGGMGFLDAVGSGSLPGQRPEVSGQPRHDLRREPAAGKAENIFEKADRVAREAREQKAAEAEARRPRPRREDAGRPRPVQVTAPGEELPAFTDEDRIFLKSMNIRF